MVINMRPHLQFVHKMQAANWRAKYPRYIEHQRKPGKTKVDKTYFHSSACVEMYFDFKNKQTA